MSSISLNFLEIFNIGIAFVDGDLRIIHTNSAALTIIDQGDVIRSVDERLTCHSSSEQRQLRATVRSAIGNRSPRCEYLALGHSGMNRTLLALVRSHPEGHRDMAGLIIAPAEAGSIPPSPHLRHWLGLTPTETDIACRIASGRSAEETAYEMGIRVGTVRTHLKHIYVKTGVGSQAQLTAKVVRAHLLLPNEIIPPNN